MQLKKALTIAGSDSGGGAGIQADLKTFAARGVYGMSVITAITAQNTIGVQGVFELPISIVKEQIKSVMKDLKPDVIKIGMLASCQIIKTVVSELKEYKEIPFVVDPVMVAKSGDRLLKKDAQSALIKYLFPLSFVITPNLHEVKALLGIEVREIYEMKKAAVFLKKMGPKNVIVKGGHLPERKNSIDILYDGKSFYIFDEKRIETKNTHGTGCTFSSAVAAELAKGKSLPQAVKIAKRYISEALKYSAGLNIGRGHGPLHHLYLLSK